MGLQITERFNTWRAKRAALDQRLVHLEPLRADLVKRLLGICALALPLDAGLLLWNIRPMQGALWIFFLLGTIWPAAGLVVAYWCLRWCRRPWRIQLATAMIFQSVVFAVTYAEGLFIKAGIPGFPHYGALLILTILLCAFLIGEFFVGAWTFICCVSLQYALHAWRGWSFNLGWSAAYVAAGWLAAQFAMHFEQFFEASRTAEEQQRSAIVAERTRFAQDIHGTLAQGFSGIMTQLDAADDELKKDSGKARAHLDKARQLAGSSLEEARRSVAALRASS